MRFSLSFACHVLATVAVASGAAASGAAASGAAASQSSDSAVERARLVGTVALEGALFHVQGVDLDRRHIWVTSVDVENRKGYLHQFDRASGRLERRVEVTDGPRYHPGGLTVAGSSIWVAVAEYRPDSSGVLEEIDKRTMVVRRRIPVADHVGCVAVSGTAIVAGNWDSRSFYVFDRTGHKLRVMANPSPTRFQDIKFERGRLVGAGTRPPHAGRIDTLEWPSLRVTDVRQVGTTDRGKPYSEEGMAIHGRDLFLVPEDGPSRMFHFRLDR